MPTLTIELSEEVYRHLVAGRSQSDVNALIETLLRPPTMDPDLEQGFADMARYEAENPDATDWSDDHVDACQDTAAMTSGSQNTRDLS